ncbi:hypothetical protein [Streptomyces chartreusis]
MVAKSENGSTPSEPIIMINGKPYGPVSAPDPAAAPLHVSIDGMPYVIQPTDNAVPPVPPAAPASPAGASAPAAPAGSTFSSVPPSLPGQFAPYAYPSAAAPPATAFPAMPVMPPIVPSPADTQPAGSADPMSAALDAVLSTAAAPTRQFPAPSWQAVTLFALVLAATVTFVICGIEIGTALGVLALISIIAAHARRGLS